MAVSPAGQWPQAGVVGLGGADWRGIGADRRLDVWAADPSDRPSRCSQTPQPRGAQRAGFDAQSVVSAHLFGVAAGRFRSRPEQHARSPAANLVLAGTIATQDPKRGVAIISDGGPSKVYSVGDNVGGASLHSVYLDHVILDRGGALETLLLPRQLGPGMHAPPVCSPSGRRPSAPWRPSRTFDAWCSRIPAYSIKSCGPCPRTTTPPESCEAFVPIRVEIGRYSASWGCGPAIW